jgi:methylated-DNA-[protein]-cysteine S-methyltransferase
MTTVHYTLLDSPIGELLITGEGGRLHSVLMPVAGVAPGRFAAAQAPAPADGWDRDDDALSDARTQLGEYFAGDRTEFTLELEPVGTPFQRRVWEALRSIPFAQTSTYGAVATAIDAPQAVRAVGAAIGRNPISVIIPCHRVVGARGALTGYAGGLDNKQWLLAHERSPRMF